MAPEYSRRPTFGTPDGTLSVVPTSLTTQAPLRGRLFLSELRKGVGDAYQQDTHAHKQPSEEGQPCATPFGRRGICDRLIPERVMNSIRNGLGMQETDIAREPGRP